MHFSIFATLGENCVYISSLFVLPLNGSNILFVESLLFDVKYCILPNIILGPPGTPTLSGRGPWPPFNPFPWHYLPPISTPHITPPMTPRVSPTASSAPSNLFNDFRSAPLVSLGRKRPFPDAFDPPASAGKRSRPADSEHVSYGGPGMAGASGGVSSYRRSYARYPYRAMSGRALAPRSFGSSAFRSAARLDRGPSIMYQRLHQPMRGFLGPAGDQKYVDIASATYACDTTGTITHLSIVPTGTTVNSRDGKAFLCTSLQLRGEMTTLSTTTNCLGAYYIVWDFQPNKALPAITDILDSANATSFIKRENASRFKILNQRHIALIGLSGTPSTGEEAFVIEDFVPIRSSNGIATCTVADTTGVIGNRVTGALYLVTVGNAAGTAAAQLTVTMRLNFRDM